MPLFEYKGLDQKGRAIKGTLDADSERAVRAKLKTQGIYPTEIAEKTTAETARLGRRTFKLFGDRIKVQDISLMTRQLSTLIRAHVPLVEGLNALSEQVENNRLRLILTEVRDRVNEGSSLADALAKHPKVFSGLYVNMIRAGESSGTLDVVSGRLSEFMEKQVALKNKVVGTMTYPVIMMGVGLLVLTALFVFVIPQITSVFKELGQALPLPTVILIKISDFVRGYWHLLLLMIGTFVWFFQRYIRTEKGKLWFDRKKLTLPIFGHLTRMIAISRFTRTLSTLLSSGVTLITAMDICKFIVNNEQLKRVVEEAKASITEGQSIAGPLKKSGEFPPLVTHMIAIGEKTGELEEMLVHVAEAYESQIESIIASLTSLLEPVMIVTMGLVVGVIVMAIMLPMLQLSGL
ncbi:MAG: type II secretion system inner membrane protein GspF [Deltaproteobacteria bacterium]|nr:type II secretion system inner membrane protein GspF [Deltaproteobacteria bacterium]